MYICENCGITHDGVQGSGRFCSDRCRRQWCASKVQNHVCNWNVHKKSQKVWICPVCGKSFETKREKQLHLKSVHYSDERTIWNKGLTKETSLSVLKGSITLKNRQKNKELEPSWLGRHHTPDTKAKLSQIRKDFLQEHPEFSPYLLSHHSKGESQSERYFRKILEKYKISFSQEFKINRYSLDFLVGKIDLEIDGSHHQNDPRVIKKDKERTKFLESKGYIVKRVDWAKYRKLSLDERKLYISELVTFLKENC